MNTLPQTADEILPANPIRVETALSRYPVHRLAKHGDIAIDIHEKNESGEVSIKWVVTHSPGPLAYKLDTLIINRRIEEATRPIPRILKLGSLRDICRELGLNEGQATRNIKSSLYQNACCFIKCKIRYRLSNGAEKSLEAGFTRYSVVLTGEELPDGRKADAVYIVLNDIYMQVINGAMTRPLDYDYLKSLPPASQRFYELLSYQMYATIKNDRPRAKLLYSELCTYAPLVRQSDWNVVRPQLARIHAPHKQSGYIAKIDFQDTVDSEGKPDWIVLYQPGPKARAEYRAFTKRGGPTQLHIEPLALESTARLPLIEHEPAPSPLVAELIVSGVAAHIAAELVRAYDEPRIRLQIEILKFRLAGKKADKIHDPAAWLVSAIKNPHSPPKGFITEAERQAREEARQAKARQQAEQKRREREEEAREQATKKTINAYWDSLTAEQQAELDAAAIAQADEEMRKLIEPGPMRRFGMTVIRDSYIRRMLESRQPVEA